MREPRESRVEENKLLFQKSSWIAIHSLPREDKNKNNSKKKVCVESGKKIGEKDSRIEGKEKKERTQERNPLLLMQ